MYIQIYATAKTLFNFIYVNENFEKKRSKWNYDKQESEECYAKEGIMRFKLIGLDLKKKILCLMMT